jgi:hypothetical protein
MLSYMMGRIVGLCAERVSEKREKDFYEFPKTSSAVLPSTICPNMLLWSIAAGRAQKYTIVGRRLSQVTLVGRCYCRAAISHSCNFILLKMSLESLLRSERG